MTQEEKINLLKFALQRGTVCISVTAWYKNAQGFYYSPVGTSNGHWVHIYKIDDTGIYVFDSYLNDGTNLKKLTLDHNIEYAKVYFFTIPTPQQSKLSQFITMLLELVGIKTKQLETILVEQDTTNPPPMNKIEQWAYIIADLEGADPKLNNPGNFKYSPLIASWGAVKDSAGSDGGYFAKFPTYEMGFTALCNFLTLGCHDELKAYHHARTIKQFTLVYTNFPKPAYDYSDTLIKRLGVTADTDISTFLTT